MSEPKEYPVPRSSFESRSEWLIYLARLCERRDKEAQDRQGCGGDLIARCAGQALREAVADLEKWDELKKEVALLESVRDSANLVWYRWIQKKGAFGVWMNDLKKRLDAVQEYRKQKEVGDAKKSHALGNVDSLERGPESH